MANGRIHFSDKKSWSAGTDVPWYDFIPRTGPNGFRNVISRLWAVADVQFDVATATTEGEDLARIFDRIKVEESDGRFRVNLRGDECRVYAYACEGVDRYSEQADVAAGNNNTRVVMMPVPLRKRFSHEPDDFCLPVDEFKAVHLQHPTDATLDIGSSAVTFDSGNFYWIAETYEEHDFQFHCKDYVSSEKMTSATEGVVRIDGKPHDLILFKTGASGGTALTGITDARIDEPTLLQKITQTELTGLYRAWRNSADNALGTTGAELTTDPFVNGKALALMLHNETLSAWDNPFVRTARIALNNTETDLQVIKRVIRHQNPDQRAAMMSIYGINPADLKVKTASKTRRELSQWPEELRGYLPLKAPLRRSASRG